MKSCYRKALLIAILLSLVLFSSQLLRAQDENWSTFKATSFQLYYGGQQQLVDSMIDQVRPGQILVIDVRSVTAFQFGRLRRVANDNGAKLLGYISIGELHRRELVLFEQFVKQSDPSIDFDQLKKQTFISENTTFQSLHADVLQKQWRAFVINKAKDILATGVDGLFLDTVDTADIYIGKGEWDLQRRAKSVTEMISLIREFHAIKGCNYFMQNRGLNLIGDTVFIGDESGITIPGMALVKDMKDNPDAVLFENAFDGVDDWSTSILHQLSEVQKAGLADVVALGYSDQIGKQAPFLKKCQKHKFIPAWASNSQNLHKEIARIVREENRD